MTVKSRTINGRKVHSSANKTPANKCVICSQDIKNTRSSKAVTCSIECRRQKMRLNTKALEDKRLKAAIKDYYEDNPHYHRDDVDSDGWIISQQKYPLRSQIIKIVASEGKCTYCQRLIGTKVNIGGSTIELRLQWDHFRPWSSFTDTVNMIDEINHPDNIMISCHLCNHIKSDHVFSTIEDARAYIIRQYVESEISKLFAKNSLLNRGKVESVEIEL